MACEESVMLEASGGAVSAAMMSPQLLKLSLLDNDDSAKVSRLSPKLVTRVIIDRVVLQDFKSYGGVKVVGPFDAKFSAIIGANGSGKSNIVDAMLFVFGMRANKLRFKKLSELIHVSNDLNLQTREKSNLLLKFAVRCCVQSISGSSTSDFYWKFQKIPIFSANTNMKVMEFLNCVRSSKFNKAKSYMQNMTTGSQKKGSKKKGSKKKDSKKKDSQKMESSRPKAKRTLLKKTLQLPDSENESSNSDDDWVSDGEESVDISLEDSNVSSNINHEDSNINNNVNNNVKNNVNSYVNSHEGTRDYRAQMAKVSVYFKEIEIDTCHGGDYAQVPDSQFVVSREVNKQSVSTYRLNECKVNQETILNMLSGKGIDLTNNRFLILQGEIESIAQMKPKKDEIPTIVNNDAEDADENDGNANNNGDDNDGNANNNGDDNDDDANKSGDANCDNNSNNNRSNSNKSVSNRVKSRKGNSNNDGLLEYLENVIGITHYREEVVELENKFFEYCAIHQRYLNKYRGALTEYERLIQPFMQMRSLLAVKIQLSVASFTVCVHGLTERITVLSAARKKVGLYRESCNQLERKMDKLRQSKRRATDDYKKADHDYKQINRDVHKLEQSIQEKDAKRKKLLHELEMDKSEHQTLLGNVGDLLLKLHRADCPVLASQSSARLCVSNASAYSAKCKHEQSCACEFSAPEQLERLAELERQIPLKQAEHKQLQERYSALQDTNQPLILMRQSDVTRSQQAYLEVQAEHKAVQTRFDEYMTRIHGEELKLKSSESQFHSLSQALTEQYRELEDCSSMLATKESRVQQLAKERSALKHKLAGMGAHADSMDGSYQKKYAHLQSLKNALASAAANSTRLYAAVMRQVECKALVGVHDKVGRLGCIADEFQKAWSISSGPFSHYFVVSQPEDASRLFDFAKAERLGRCFAFSIEQVERDMGQQHDAYRKASAPATVKQMCEEKGISDAPKGILAHRIHRLYDLVQPVDTQYALIFFKIAGKTLVTETLDSATFIATHMHRRCATVKGEVAEEDGRIVSGGIYVESARNRDSVDAIRGRLMTSAEAELCRTNTLRDEDDSTCDQTTLQSSISDLDKELKLLEKNMTTEQSKRDETEDAMRNASNNMKDAEYSAKLFSNQLQSAINDFRHIYNKFNKFIHIKIAEAKNDSIATDNTNIDNKNVDNKNIDSINNEIESFSNVQNAELNAIITNVNTLADAADCVFENSNKEEQVQYVLRELKPQNFSDLVLKVSQLTEQNKYALVDEYRAKSKALLEERRAFETRMDQLKADERRLTAEIDNVGGDESKELARLLQVALSGINRLKRDRSKAEEAIVKEKAESNAALENLKISENLCADLEAKICKGSDVGDALAKELDELTQQRNDMDVNVKLFQQLVAESSNTVVELEREVGDAEKNYKDAKKHLHDARANTVTLKKDVSNLTKDASQHMYTLGTMPSILQRGNMHVNDGNRNGSDANIYDSSGNIHDSSGNVHDSSGNIHDSSGNMHDSSGNIHDSSGNIHGNDGNYLIRILTSDVSAAEESRKAQKKDFGSLYDEFRIPSDGIDDAAYVDDNDAADAANVSSYGSPNNAHNVQKDDEDEEYHFFGKDMSFLVGAKKNTHSSISHSNIQSSIQHSDMHSSIINVKSEEMDDDEIRRQLFQAVMENASCRRILLKHKYPMEASCYSKLTMKKLEAVLENRRDAQDKLGDLNMSVITNFISKRRECIVKKRDMVESSREKKNFYDDFDRVCVARKREFMDNFDIISNNFKHMYQLITNGGDAELELVDAHDPFSEGVVLSVRPCRKTWKEVRQLSGGEKTLSSLAFIFALHNYRPNCMYFMDEIDAALDFKNVSIIAKYISQKAFDAQFIVISLRQQMFSCANKLVGISKTHDITKSITFPNVKV